jgi:hypothetical protein
MKGSPYKLEAIGDIVRESLLVKQAILGEATIGDSGKCWRKDRPCP